MHLSCAEFDCSGHHAYGYESKYLIDVVVSMPQRQTLEWSNTVKVLKKSSAVLDHNENNCSVDQ